MASDLRVPLDPILRAFGVTATVIPPPPEDVEIPTTVVWDSGMTGDGGSPDFRRREQRRVMAIPRDVGAIVKHTVILAPLMAGGPVKAWRMDTVDRVMEDLLYVVVVEDAGA